MASVIKRNMRSFDARNFLNRVRSVNGAVEHIIYAALSGTTPWVDELLPPAPLDTIQAELDVWSEVIGFQRIAANQITMVVPRINWEPGVSFVAFDNSNANAFATRFYCITANFQVFMTNSVGVGTVVTEPVWTTASGTNTIDTGDGYTWTFLYDLTTADIQNTIKDNWLPVNVLGRYTPNQTAFGKENADILLGARHVMLEATITDAGIPLNVSYRKLALLLDPVASPAGGGGPLVTSTATPDQVVANSGDILYIEYRKEINREAGQTESPSIVIQF